MSVIEKLATTLQIRSDEPNQKLADEIIETKDGTAVQELVQNLFQKNKAIQSDCIKVLYEIGERGTPELIAPYWKEFLRLLSSKNNRLVWGAMIALDMIALLKPKELFEHIDLIRNTVNHGSVITMDHGVSIYAKLTSIAEFEDKALHFLWDALRTCPPKQFPQYLERSVIAINKKNLQLFTDLAEAWMPMLERDSQRKRVEKVILLCKAK
jgi:hypothetical protein